MSELGPNGGFKQMLAREMLRDEDMNPTCAFSETVEGVTYMAFDICKLDKLQAAHNYL